MVKMVVQLIWFLQTSFFLELLSAEVDFSKGKLRESDLESQTTPQYLQSNKESCAEKPENNVAVAVLDHIYCSVACISVWPWIFYIPYHMWRTCSLKSTVSNLLFGQTVSLMSVHWYRGTKMYAFEKVKIPVSVSRGLKT